MMSTWCSKHVEAFNKSYYKTRICALSWLITKIIFVLFLIKNLGKMWALYLSDATLRSLMVTDISGQLLGPVLKGQA